MRKVLVGLFLGISMVMLMTGRAVAANLSQTTVRLSRMAAGASPLPVLVMAKTNNVVTEDGVSVQVGSGWVVDTNPGNLTVKTTGLPSGVSPWPGIGTATGVSGQTVNFPGGNLTAGVNYGFYITGGIGINPGSAGNYQWTVTTLVGGNPSDQMTVGVPVTESDTVTLTGKVGANAADFQLGMTAQPTGNLSVGDEVTYQINYGTYLLSVVRPLVITAEWSRGTVSGSPIPSVDIADYVVGSGTTAWGGVEPVIDLVNRKITWTISSFPADTVNQQVEFKLAVNDSYSGSSDVTFTTTAGLNGANVVSMSSSVDSVYHPVAQAPTPTPTPIPPTSTSAPQPTGTSSTTAGTVTPTVIPTPTLVALKIGKIEVVTLSNSGITIEVDANVVPKTIEVWYGTSMAALDSSLISVNGIKKDFLNIDGLKQGTDYFFRVIVTDTSGNAVKSDVYTFKTATSTEKPEIDPKSIVISSADNILLDTEAGNNGVNAVVLTADQNYALRINLTKAEIVESVKVMIVNSQVLGISTVYGAEPNSVEENLAGIGSGGFLVHLVAPKTEGFYDITVRIEDINGNISEEKIGKIRVTPPLTVVDEKGQPVEDAKVVFYHFNEVLKTYDLTGWEMFGVQNPSYTETNGQVTANFPKGGYRVDVSQAGFVEQVVDFSLGLGENEKMPRVVLKKAAIGLPILISYYGGVSKDFLNFSRDYFYNLTTSSRFFRLTLITAVMTGLVVLWLFAANSFFIYWWLLPKKIFSKIKNRFGRKPTNVLQGIVSDTVTGMPVNGVKAYLVDDKFNRVLSKSITDKLGEFQLLIKPSTGYRLAAIKDGFEPTAMMDFTAEGIKAGRVHLKIKNVISLEEKIESAVRGTIQRIGGWLWSVWLLWLAAIELIFWGNFGLGKAWLGVAVSLLSLGWWLTVILKKNAVEKD